MFREQLHPEVVCLHNYEVCICKEQNDSIITVDSSRTVHLLILKQTVIAKDQLLLVSLFFSIPLPNTGYRTGVEH